MMSETKPDGCHYYAESEDGRFRFIAWGPPPESGGKLCMALTGMSVSRFVEAILNGKYDHILQAKRGRNQ